MSCCSGVEVTASVTIGDDVAIEYHVFEDGLVEFRVGGRNGFDLLTTETGLGNFMDRAQEALYAARSAIATDEEGVDGEDSGDP
jgi:hypothetical protein